MRDLVPQLKTPRAIVVVSPHWETAVPTVGCATRPETLHDFGGFDPRLYDMRYPAPGSPEVAALVVDALQKAQLPAAQDVQRGLDHGAWTPLRQMFPDANIPVVPLSVQSHLGPLHAYRVGQALACLAAQNILLVGSGNITHNLRDVMAARTAGAAPPPTTCRPLPTGCTPTWRPAMCPVCWPTASSCQASAPTPPTSTCCRCSPLGALLAPLHSLKLFSGASVTMRSPWMATAFTEEGPQALGLNRSSRPTP